MENAGSIVNEGKGQTGFAKVKTVLGKINRVINLIGLWLFRLRKFVLAAPVVYYALKLAEYNRTHLPEQVGINLQSTGEFAQYISRNLAVMGPLESGLQHQHSLLISKAAIDGFLRDELGR